MEKRLKKAYEYLDKRFEGKRPLCAAVLGSGLGAVSLGSVVAEAEYAEIPGFPQSTVDGHKGRFLLMDAEGVLLLVMQGRVHYYEGYTMPETVMTVRLAAMLGAKAVVLTNAAGAVNPDYKIGDIMLIKDHIMLAPNPLIGKNISFLGERFPDMTGLYDTDILKKAASDLNVDFKEGVYIQFSGPSYETAAEVRMARMLGADAAGMSTAAEAVAARHAGMRVAGLSVITNMATGVTGQKLSHKEVSDAGKKASATVASLLLNTIREITKNE